MNLLVVTHVYPANPLMPADIAGNFLPPFLHELARLGAIIRVLAPQSNERDTPDPQVPITRFSWWRDGTRPLGQFRLANPFDAGRLTSLISGGIRELKRQVANDRFDAVLACWAIPSGFIASYGNVPFAVWGLGTDIHTMARNPFARPFVTRALKRASLRYANSLTLARQVNSLGFDCSLLPNVRLLPRDVPPANLPHDRFNFLCAARLERVKGIDILLDAVAQVHALHSKNGDISVKPRVYIAGTGSLENDLRTQAARLNLQDDVIFLGFLDERAMAAALAACDALVIPSRDESIPMVFKEAARFGVPVVATDVGDLRAFVSEYAAGIIVPPNDASALAKGMQRIICSPREAFRTRLVQLAEQFDLTHSAERLLGDLERLTPKEQRH